jgi:uncharacterized protein
LQKLPIKIPAYGNLQEEPPVNIEIKEAVIGIEPMNKGFAVR